ncbi:enoyl-CoA-hydratase DpgB [Streptomyces sp. NPDC021093]|uniref:enoyl-CoA-hydratase DpgB n=1 Tax=Streptomyces sp. NPDC021093 TaxID=3365112 RepID=UPI0037B254D6
MMNATTDTTLLPDDLGLRLTVDGTRPLAELTAAVNALCEQAESRTEKSVVVLELAAVSPESRAWPTAVGISDVNRWERAVRRLEKLPSATLAVASGTCGGPALDLLLVADFRIASPGLVLMFPVNDGRFWPGMAVFRLVQHIGVARARRFVLWGIDLPLDEATELGLIDQVSEDLEQAVHTATVLMGRASDRELALRRQLLLEAASVEYDDALGVHLAACDRELRLLGAGERAVDARTTGERAAAGQAAGGPAAGTPAAAPAKPVGSPAA